MLLAKMRHVLADVRYQLAQARGNLPDEHSARYYLDVALNRLKEVDREEADIPQHPPGEPPTA